MPASPEKIAELRKIERDTGDHGRRQALALEHIADTLEAFRVDFVGYLAMIARQSEKR